MGGGGGGLQIFLKLKNAWLHGKEGPYLSNLWSKMIEMAELILIL